MRTRTFKGIILEVQLLERRALCDLWGDLAYNHSRENEGANEERAGTFPNQLLFTRMSWGSI